MEKSRFLNFSDADRRQCGPAIFGGKRKRAPHAIFATKKNISLFFCGGGKSARVGLCVHFFSETSKIYGDLTSHTAQVSTTVFSHTIGCVAVWECGALTKIARADTDTHNPVKKAGDFFHAQTERHPKNQIIVSPSKHHV